MIARESRVTRLQPGEVRFEPRAGGLRYRQPCRIIRAEQPGEVRAALAAVEAETRAGRHAAGMIAYEAAPGFDPALRVHSAPAVPLLWFGIYEAPEPARDPEPNAPVGELGPWRSEWDEACHGAAVEHVRRCIAAGETYQANVTFRIRAAFDGDPLALAGQLWSAQRGGLGAVLHLGEQVIVSASPELFFRLAGDRLESRPMKGTRPRGRTPEEDAALAAALRASEKERAENLMIVDMVRNDLGRVARTGSVDVPGLYQVEAYPTVWQMTSTVTARSDAPLVDIVAALFPCASVTGAPKVRTMGLLAGLEPSPRGVYCGAIGWIAPGRRACFNVAIRTVTIAGGVAEYGVGGGIVWDSTPADEWAECLAKCRVLEPPPDGELLETLLWQPGWLLLERHLARLLHSAALFGWTVDPPTVRRALDQAVVGETSPRRVRLTVDRAGRPAVSVAPAPEPRRFRVGLAASPIDSTCRMLAHKTTRREIYDAALAARPGLDDVILHNERGELTESTIANLVLRLDGRLVTPPLDSGLLPGVMRAELLARGEIAEQVLTIAELDRAEEVWLVNSVRGWMACELHHG